MERLTLLGPQRLQPTLVEFFDRLGVTGQVAAITAGWQEREAENDELQQHLGRPVVDLRLHRRCDEAFAADPELFAAHRARQDRLREMQQLYRYRLDFAIKPARQLLRRSGDPELLVPEREAAIAALRRLDDEHRERIAVVHRDFERAYWPAHRPAVAAHRAEIRQILRESSAVAIAGGHVAVLVNRMRLFGITDLIGDLPVFAWSAGAMVLGERIILFHDRPPWGAGSAEVLDVGLGLYEGLVALPHARRRLRLEDPARVALFARRFSPALCMALDEGSAVCWDSVGWRPLANARRLTVEGAVTEMAAAENGRRRTGRRAVKAARRRG